MTTSQLNRSTLTLPPATSCAAAWAEPTRDVHHRAALVQQQRGEAAPQSYGLASYSEIVGRIERAHRCCLHYPATHAKAHLACRSCLNTWAGRAGWLMRLAEAG